jgi:hypothetical protein
MWSKKKFTFFCILDDATLTTNSSEISDSDISISQIKTNLPTKRHIERRSRHKKVC